MYCALLVRLESDNISNQKQELFINFWLYYKDYLYTDFAILIYEYSKIWKSIETCVSRI